MKLSNSFFWKQFKWLPKNSLGLQCGPLVLDGSMNISYINSSTYPKVKLVKVLNKRGVAHVMDKISHTVTFGSIDCAIDCASHSFSSCVDNNNCNMFHYLVFPLNVIK
jgi:hypothetical protein